MEGTQKKTIEGLYYADKTLFFIPKYYCDGTGMAETIVENINTGIAMLKQFEPKKTVYTHQILQSRRYKHMRVYHVNDVAKCPPEAFMLDGDWTMDKWING